MSVQNEIEVGTVFKTFHEMHAMPKGTRFVTRLGRTRSVISDTPGEWRYDSEGAVRERELPVMVVEMPAPPEPEWLDAAAGAMRSRFLNCPVEEYHTLPEHTKNEYREACRAAVAAADKARGIVNSREEFGQLPYASRVVGPCVTGGYVRADYLDIAAIDALAYPAIVYTPADAR